MFFTLLTLIIPNHKLLITLFLQSLSNYDEHLSFASLRHLRQLDTKCYHSNKLWGYNNPIVVVKHNSILLTKFTCCCVHATFFVSWYTKEQRKLRRRNQQRLYSTESELSVVVLAWSDTGNTYKYFTCNGDKRPMRVYVVRLHLMVSVLCLTVAWCQPSHACLRDKESTWHNSST